jgi:hypothetical protein
MSKTKITINPNGSLKVEGDIEIVDADGNQYGFGGRTNHFVMAHTEQVSNT